MVKPGGGSFLGGRIPTEHLYDNPDGKRAIAPSIDRIRKNIPWLAEQQGWIVWQWSDEAQKRPHRGAHPYKRKGWPEAGTQATLEEAWETYQEHDHIDGIGFVFNGTEDEILEDFDDCINPWADTISDPCLEDALDNDDEPAFFSTSGTGAHRYPVATDAEDTKQHPHEVYIGDDGNHRWAAVTGFKIAGDQHGPDRSERVNELSEEHNEAEAKTVDLREFDFDADPTEIDEEVPLPDAIMEAFDGDVPRCIGGLIYVLGTHDPTDPDGPGWGQQTFTRYSHLLILLADHLGADAEELAELIASFKSPAIAAAQRGEHPKKGAKDKPHGEGVPWDLDYQAGKIAPKVANDDLSSPKVETIEEHCNIKIEGCDCPVHSWGGSGGSREEAATDGGATTAHPEGDDPAGPEVGASGDDDEHPLVKLFREACEHYNVNPDRVSAVRGEDGERWFRGVDRILAIDSVAGAVMSFNEEANELSGTQRQAVIARAVSRDLDANGEFFRTKAGWVYYYHEDADDDADQSMYRVDGEGNRVLNETFQAFVWENYHLLAGQFSRNLGRDMLSYIRRNSPEREVHRFAHYDESAAEVYISDWGDGYYAITPETIEWRPNGTDLFFLGLDRAEPFEYIEGDNRPDLPDEIPGELPHGDGDAIMRLFGNRVNYSEHAALGPLQQRQQLYLHLHVLPFGSKLIGKPIMAWVGEKGSGKTMTSRAIGKFLIGPEFTESLMPDDRDDFEAKVVNQPLAFIDNYDEGQEWANSMLAAIATGTGVDKRELYTTSDLRSEVPDCWLSLTSREPPFRRDDVADRLLLFHVERFDGDFIGEGNFLDEVQATEDHPARRNLLWSVYLDNVQAVLAELESRDTGRMSSTHRMAGWAILAQITADALDIQGVDSLLETMEAERATFALGDETWAAVIGDWIDANPRLAGDWRKASDLHDKLEETAESNSRKYDVGAASGLGSKLSKYHDELATLYGLEIDDSGRTNKYRFDSDREGERSDGWF